MTRPNILIINPNTAEDITSRILALAVDECGDDAQFTSVTARFGARYISDRAAATIAAHAVLDAYAVATQAGPSPDAVIVACFGDPGLEALVERLAVPVVGFAEAGLRQAGGEAGRFLIATIGDSWRDMLTELVARLGLSAQLAGFALLGDSERTPEAASQAITRAAERLGAERAVLGGTGLIPLIAAIGDRLALPIIDPHRVALREAVARGTRRAAAAIRRASPSGTFSGLSVPLTHLLEQPALHDIQTDQASR